MEGDPAERGTTARLLVLGAGPAQLGLLTAARARGLFVIAVDRDPKAVGFQHADRRAIISAEDEPGIERLAQALQVDGVIAPGIDWPVAIAARVADRLGLPHPIDPATAGLATSKLRQRERFGDRGVPQPRWQVIGDDEVELEPPLVVKPPDRQGQKGLIVVRERAALAAAVEEARAASRGGLVLAEELVEGPEVTVNAFSTGGVFRPLLVTDRLTAPEPAFGVALAHAWPSWSERPRSGPGEGARGNREVPPPVGPRRPVDEAVETARAAAEALGIEDGPTYTQIRLAPAGPQVMELAARLGGGHDAELCLRAVGVDPNRLALAAALGEDPGEIAPVPRVGGACTRFLVAPPGTLRDVVGSIEALGLEGVVDVLVYRERGSVCRPLRHGADRAGAVIAVGASRAEALERAERAAERIRFDTVDAEALV